MGHNGTYQLHIDASGQSPRMDLSMSAREVLLSSVVNVDLWTEQVVCPRRNGFSERRFEHCSIYDLGTESPILKMHLARP